MTKQNGTGTLERIPETAIESQTLTTVDLNGLERILIRGVLPSEGSLMTVKVLRELHNILELGQDEIADYNIPTSGIVSYADLERIPARPIAIGPVDRELIVAGLKRLDKEKKVTVQHVSLFETFGVEPVAAE